MSPRTRSVLLLSLSFITALGCSTRKIASPAAPAVGTADSRYAAAIESGRASLRPLLAARPGLSVAVAIDGQTVWSEGEGWADSGAGRPVNSETRFRIYSNSKPITATAALRLASQKRLDLDAPISRYLQDVPPALANVTTRQLLGHMAGIRHYRDGEWLPVSRRHCTTAREALAVFINDPLVSAPGQSYHYSSFGYVLVSAIIEAATGESFNAVVQREVLDPAGMKNTSPDGTSAAEATAYDHARGRGIVVGETIDNSCKFGAGGFVSTADDLARFGSALMAGKILAAPELRAMTTPAKGADGKVPGYGLGVIVASDPDLGALFAHSGGALGGRSYILANPDHRLVVAIASNIEGDSLKGEALAIAKAFAAQIASSR